MEIAKLAKNSPKFSCNCCDYKCRKLSDIKKHEATDKHKRRLDGNTGNKMEMNFVAKMYYDCICGKKYETYCGIWKHKQKCTHQPINNTNNIIVSIKDDGTSNNSMWESDNMIISTNPISKYEQHEKDITQLTHLVIEVVKNNSELQKQMLDMCKNMQSTMTNCNNTNSHNTTNNSFNLQVFLNEHCKDAMNISEFIDSFDLQLSDLENVGRQGYIEGMSTIIINKIKDMDVNKRPLHCSDLKREVIYIKDDNVWEREDANNTKFRKVVGKVMRKNIGMLNGWRDKYPECMDIESEYNDIYVRLTKEAMGPEDTIDSENKIIKRVLKQIVIDKKAIF